MVEITVHKKQTDKQVFIKIYSIFHLLIFQVGIELTMIAYLLNNYLRFYCVMMASILFILCNNILSSNQLDMLTSMRALLNF